MAPIPTGKGVEDRESALHEKTIIDKENSYEVAHEFNEENQGWIVAQGS